MLPSDLQAILKTTKKSVGTTENYTETSYTDKLFMLSSIELGYNNQYDKGFGATYSYYSEASQQESALRIKKQIKIDGHITSSTIPSTAGQAYQGEVYNAAGYVCYWLCSPSSSDSECAFGCDGDSGKIVNNYMLFTNAFGIAPAFCL